MELGITNNVSEIEKATFVSLNNMINSIEKKLNITILYACETGSRAAGVNVETSDYDIKGFYIAKESEYLRVIRSVNPIYIHHHINLVINEYEYDLDIEFRDIYHYFNEKIQSEISICDFWFKSKVIYRNLLDVNFFNLLNKHLKPKIFIFSPHDKSGLETLKKLLQKKIMILNKKLLCLLISAIQQLHTEIFNNQFPLYNIFEEIEFLRENMDKCKEKLNDEEIILLQKNLVLVEDLYVRKKGGRLSTTKSIPECISLFISIINDKFNPEKKRKDFSKLKGTLDEEWAQDKFEEYLYNYNN
jgi:hypothetical protein